MLVAWPVTVKSHVKRMRLFLNYLILTLVIPEIYAKFHFIGYLCRYDIIRERTTYESNVNSVLTSLSSAQPNTYGYYNFSAGEIPNKVSAMVLCRGDISQAACRLCLHNSIAAILRSNCYKYQAFGFTDDCVICYTNEPLFHGVTVRPRKERHIDEDVSNITVFNSTVYNLLNRLLQQASMGDSQLKFATGNMSLTSNKTLYGLVQCSPDLSTDDCTRCVRQLMLLISNMITPTFTAAGGRTSTPSCNFRYETYRFYGNQSYFPTPHVPPPSTLIPSATPPTGSVHSADEKRKKSRCIAPIIAAVAVVGAILFTAVICLYFRKKRDYLTKFNQDHMERLPCSRYSLGALKAATNNFSENHKLGEGGFGAVYKGKLPDGQEIAVKRLLKNAKHGTLQFENEILTLAKLQHRNLVRLLGFCFDNEEMLLVYEFVINSSLDHFLRDPLKRASLQWEMRYKIINGIAKGLLHLHEDSRLRIIHCDLKAGNVLLDAEYNPKIADFGMARLFNIDQTRSVASKIVGTYGYMAPEYVIHGHVSLKSDVFSFGVLVLEIISGHTISRFHEENEGNLLSFAWKNWIEGKARDLIDPTLSGGTTTEILRCIHIALLCVQHNVTDRPRISGVILMLSSDTVPVQVPSQPAFFNSGHGTSSDQSNDKSAVANSID